MSQAVGSDKLNGNKTSSSVEEKLSKAMDMANRAKNQKISEAKKELLDTYHDTQERYEDLKSQATEMIESSRKSVEENVESHPYRFILGAGLLGLAIGFLMSKK